MSHKRVSGRLALASAIALGVVVFTGSATATAAVGPAPASATNAAVAGALGRFGPLTDLVVQRLQVSDEVAASKFGTGQSIDDPTREQQELDAVRQSAQSLGINPDATVQFFQQQITASKIVQQGLFDLWTAHPELAPTSRPDLTQIRDQLDQLTTELLQQLVAVRDILPGSVECTVQLDQAKISGEIVYRLDSLHRDALTVALSSVCAKTS